VELLSQIWNNLLIEPMINSLVLLYSICGSNFGLAIVVFTILTRGLMFPLTVKQSRQMKAMTALQPKLKEIQAKHKNDRSKISQETMKMYKDQGVNPIGCLGPMFIQMPIFIGLYQAIMKTVPSAPENLIVLSRYLYGWLPINREAIPIDSTFFWLDLARPDSYVLPVLVGISMFVMQKMTSMPAMDDRQAQTNKMMLWMMPIMFGVMASDKILGGGFPSGLAVYWTISNIVGIVIQGMITGWEPLINLLTFFKTKKKLQPALISAGVNEALIEEQEKNETDTDDRENSRGRNRNSSDRVRRKSPRGGNRGRKQR
jgi:YidC/Oxa1 family membrane protein insertase